MPARRFPSAIPDGNAAIRGMELHTPGGKTFRVTAVRLEAAAPANRPAIVQVAFDRTYEEHLFEQYRTNLLVVLSLALVACTVVGYQIARSGLRPLTEISATSRRIRSSTLHERIAAAGLPGELFVLASTF